MGMYNALAVAGLGALHATYGNQSTSVPTLLLRALLAAGCAGNATLTARSNRRIAYVRVTNGSRTVRAGVKTGE